VLTLKGGSTAPFTPQWILGGAVLPASNRNSAHRSVRCGSRPIRVGSRANWSRTIRAMRTCDAASVRPWTRQAPRDVIAI